MSKIKRNLSLMLGLTICLAPLSSQMAFAEEENSVDKNLNVVNVEKIENSKEESAEVLEAENNVNVEAVNNPVTDSIRKYVNDNKAKLGTKLTDIRCGLVDGACVQTFRNSAGDRIAVYASNYSIPTSINLNSPIGKHWVASGWENGKLGYPILDIREFDKNVYVQHFQKGLVFLVNGKVYELLNTNSMTSVFMDRSYPITNMRCGLRDNGCVQTFKIRGTNTRIAYYSQANSTPHGVDLDSPFGKYFAQNGWENGKLGYPISDVINLGANEPMQRFEKGTLVLHNGKVHFQAERSKADELNNVIKLPGNEGSKVISPVKCGLTRGGCVITILKPNGEKLAYYSTPNIPPIPINLNSDIGLYFAKNGWENGKLGYPLFEAEYLHGKTKQLFENGTLYANGKNLIPIYRYSPTEEYASSNGKLFPTNNMKCGLPNNGCVQSFENVSNGDKFAVYAYGKDRRNFGVVKLFNSITTLWKENGWEISPLGYPVDEPYYEENRYLAQRFENAKVVFKDGNFFLETDKNNPKGKIVENWKKNSLNIGKAERQIKCGLRENGCVQSFRDSNGHRHAIYASNLFKEAANIDLDTKIGKYFKENGWENGKLGYPVNDYKKFASDKIKQGFEKALVFESGKNLIVMTPDNPITGYYHQYSRFVNRNLFPISSQKCTLKDKGCVQSFVDVTTNEKHAIYLHTDQPVIINLTHPIAKHWIKSGWENGKFGYPVEVNIGANKEGSITFQNGKITYSNGKITESK